MAFLRHSLQNLLRRLYYSYFHFTDKEAEAQGGPHNWLRAAPQCLRPGLGAADPVVLERQPLGARQTLVLTVQAFL